MAQAMNNTDAYEHCFENKKVLRIDKISTGPSTNNGTMISYSEGTMVQHDTGPGTAQSKTMSEIGSFLLLQIILMMA